MLNILESRADILLALQDALTVENVSVVQLLQRHFAMQLLAWKVASGLIDYAKRAQNDNSDPLRNASVPLSTQTFGRLGKPAMELINKPAECASAGGILFEDGFVVNALRELSVGLCRGNCVLYKRSLDTLARVSGNAFRAGADIRNRLRMYFLPINDCPSVSPRCCFFASRNVVPHTVTSVIRN